MSPDQWLLWYKVLRIALLVGVLYGIVYYLWFTKRGKQAEVPAQRMLEEKD